MKKTLYILFIFLLGGSISAQKHVFKIRKVPQLKYFVFADGFNKHNLEEKKLENKSFPKRLYLQVYENDTFLIRWSDWKLAEANIKLDYLKRDSLTFAGKIIRQKKTGMKFIFPYKGETFHMFSISQEPLVKQRNYKAGKPGEQKKRVSFYFTYKDKSLILGDMLLKQVKENQKIEVILKSSARVKLGFYSNELYANDAIAENLPLNIVNTYPVHFILENSKTCQQTLFWNGVPTTKYLNINDTAQLSKDRAFVNNLPSENILSIDNNQVEYYQARRYVHLENDSQLVASDYNRGCSYFQKKLNNLDGIPLAPYWDTRDGINNYLTPIGNKLWGWVSKYGCLTEWKVYEENKIKTLLSLPSQELFKQLNYVTVKSSAILNLSCKK
ncbi:hypothetical protein N8089_00700 [Flavobacteriales bacterium]|nr:hypothetical protein [Flavobacteriales bacterium]